MAQYLQKEGSRFTVDLGNIKLPPIIEKQVETDIRAVVLRALSDTDSGGISRLGPSIFDRFPGRTLGLWLDPDNSFPPSGGPLTPQDHTLIVRAIMRKPFNVLRYLDTKPGSEKPSGIQVLEAALKVEQIDAYTKERIEVVLKILPKLEDANAKVTRTMQRALETLGRQLAGQTIEAQVRILRDSSIRSKLAFDGFAEGMDFAAMILEDGASSIYTEDFGFYGTLGEGETPIAKKDKVDTVKDADSLGAVAGGGVGVFVAGVGAGPGAAAGAAGASAGAAIALVIDWIF